MIIEVKVKNGKKNVKKQVEVSGDTLLAILKPSVAGEIISQIGEGPMKDIDGYIVSIIDKD